MEKNFQKLKELVKLHSEEKWRRNQYMLGITNGLILALATLEGKEPIFIKKKTNFVKFLKTNGVEIKDFESRLFDWEYEIDKNQTSDWIAGAFDWDDQPEDRGFWWDLHNEWIEICNTQETEYGKEFPTIS